MNRRAFLSNSLLAAPALLTLSSLPALAASTGSTLIEAPGLNAAGTFDSPGFGPGGNGRMTLSFATGPDVTAQVGPRAIDRLLAARRGDRFGVHYIGLAGIAEYQAEWNIEMESNVSPSARFRIDGTLEATASSLVAGDRDAGVGLAAMILAALSAGSVLRGGSATNLSALITPRAAPAGMAFGLDVTVQA